MLTCDFSGIPCRVAGHSTQSRAARSRVRFARLVLQPVRPEITEVIVQRPSYRDAARSRSSLLRSAAAARLPCYCGSLGRLRASRSGDEREDRCLPPTVSHRRARPVGRRAVPAAGLCVASPGKAGPCDGRHPPASQATYCSRHCPCVRVRSRYRGPHRRCCRRYYNAGDRRPCRRCRVKPGRHPRRRRPHSTSMARSSGSIGQPARDGPCA